MKKWTFLSICLLCALTSMAQAPEQLLSHVRNANLSSTEPERQKYTKELASYLSAHPEAVHSQANAYTNAEKEAAVAMFCVAVDLGNVDVVKAFLAAGMRDTDLCTVQLFTDKKVIVSKADYLYAKNPRRSTSGSWISKKAPSTPQTDLQSKYTEMSSGEKKPVNTYMAFPLDFADGEMFDFLWQKGFRSPNLLTKQALLAAKSSGRTEVWNYIMSQKPEVLSDRPTYVSKSDYRALLDVAAAIPYGLTSDVLALNVLSKVNTSAQAAAAQTKLKQEMARAVKVGTDTTGYARMYTAVHTGENVLRKEEERAAEARRLAEERAAEERRLAEERAAEERRVENRKRAILDLQECREEIPRRIALFNKYGKFNFKYDGFQLVDARKVSHDIAAIFGEITVVKDCDTIVSPGGYELLYSGESVGLVYYHVAWFQGATSYWDNISFWDRTRFLDKNGKVVKDFHGGEMYSSPQCVRNGKVVPPVLDLRHDYFCQASVTETPLWVSPQYEHLYEDGKFPWD